MPKRRFIFHFLAFITIAIWGVTFISTKVLINNGLHPAPIFTIRFVMAYLGILVFSFIHKDRIWASSFRDEVLFVFLGLTGGSFYFLLENMALKYTMACNVAFIVCSAPLWTALLTLFMRRYFHGPLVSGLEDIRVSPSLVFGTLITFVGLGLVIFTGRAVELSAKGDWMALGAALMWAFYSILMSQMSDRYGSLFATRKVFFYGLVTIIPFISVGEGSMFDMDWGVLLRPAVMWNLLFLGLIASLLCFWLWNLVMARLGNITSTNYVYLNPIFTFFAAVLFLGESLTLLPALGCAAIIGGVVLAGRR